jgi:hypothetical protein
MLFTAEKDALPYGSLTYGRPWPINAHRNRCFVMIELGNVMIFQRYIKLPEGN